MPHDENVRVSPSEWLRHAKSHLIRAKFPKLPETFWEHYCFDAQQAAEKAIKAVMLWKGIDFPFVHDIRGLLTLLEQAGVGVPPEIWRSDDLTDYAVDMRYPGGDKPVTEEEYKQAVALAEKVVQWAEGIIVRAGK